MKKLLIFCLMINCLKLVAQSPATYSELLELSHELNLSDSLFIPALNNRMQPIDSYAVKKWFAPILSASNAKMSNRNFFLAGKITSHENFDLHVLVEDKKKTDSSTVQIIHLITTRKTGDYIASFKAAINGNRKKTSYYTATWLLKGLAIVQDSKITTETTSLQDVSYYKINTGGRFIMNSQ